MILDFNTIPANAVPHFKGGEGEAIVRKFDDPRMGAVVQLTLPAGSSIGLHTHETNCEVIYILSGTGKVLCDGVYEPLAPGACHYCPKGHAHSLINDSDGDLTFFAVVPEQ